MGTKYQYNCSNCAYSVGCSGEIDYGYFGVVNSYICYDCKEVVDVNIGLMMQIFDPDNIKNEINKMQLSTNTKPEEFYTCPECNGKNITVWSKTKFACPKCNSKMNIDLENIMMWD